MALRTQPTKLKSYLKPYWLLALLSPAFMILEVSMDLIQPKFMSDIIDNGVLSNNMDLIIHTGILMLGTAVLGCAGGILSGVFGVAASQSFGNDLRKDVFAKVMSFSLQQTDKFTTGSLVTRLTNDVTACQDFVSMALRMLVRSSMQFIGGIVMVLSLNVNFGVILIVSLPVQLIFLAIILKKAAPLFGVVQSKLDKVNSVVQENVTGARVVKAYTREKYEIKRFGKANEELMTTNLRVQKLLAVLSPILMIIMNASVLAIIYIGGLQVEAKAMQVGEVMAAITYITQILMSVMMLGNIFQQVSRAKASADRIRQVLDEQPVIVTGEVKETSSTGAVRFENVSFYYPGHSGKPVLKNINLDIKHGETVAVLGATGCGKTSLVNLIPRFYDATGGNIYVDGINVKEYDIKILRKKISIVLQKSELFSGTVFENIRWGCDTAADDEVIRAAKIAQADEFVSGFNGGYNSMISEKGASLSGGQKQRLAIARAILKKPEILIFDDSTSALDLSTEAKLHKALKENLTDVTVIMIAQRVASVMSADRIAVVDGGEIVAFGTHSELMQTSDIYRDIYQSQMRNGGTE